MQALIMAGGLGTRFWPKSRRAHPKQMLKIFGERTLIQNTVDRLLPVIDAKNIFVVSTQDQLAKIKEQLPELPGNNFIIEPKGKNTAPCIGLAALFMEKKNPDEIMIVLPADHVILNEALFHKTLKVGAKTALESDSIVTIGIAPQYPATGYGYIQFTDEITTIDDIGVYKVKTFAEKPNRETAERFIESGDFLWNSGIFIWKIQKVLDEIKENIPELYDGLMEIKSRIGAPDEEQTINRVYCQIRSISIDIGVMEQAREVRVLKGTFGWNDLGSWDEVYKLQNKDNSDNVLIGEHILKDSTGCFVDAPNRCIAMVDMQNIIVVDTGDVILICQRDKAQNVKELIEIAKRKKMTQYL